MPSLINRSIDSKDQMTIALLNAIWLNSPTIRFETKAFNDEQYFLIKTSKFFIFNELSNKIKKLNFRINNFF